ncbi:hypothetical protein SAMN05421820_106375 [Pedobacter steynii]|uniref:Uncharacterized protein n=1 Tax=Pedobacter steynii TaxID=430522 RepID=A0A1G9Z7X2_9SPHI|nr:DUF6266 family protein [Pedobacter steynii]NQX39973.1 hypothetical protein [Pedobacter steynii]SDN17217.1 hypothetical protein SAMN05421820_106375 [Pedobacter steynii]
MARITKGLLGGFSGKIGAVVGYTLYGIDRMRSLPDRTAPPTENELKNRSQFKLVQETLNPIKELLKLGFKDYWTVSGGTRGALSYNRQFAVKATEEGYEINPEHFKISGGSLPGLTGLKVLQESEKFLSFHWNQESAPGGSGYDQVMLLAIDLKGQKSCYECPGNFRSAGTGLLQLSEDLSGKEVDVYIGVLAKDRSVQSDSQYLGRIQLQAAAPILNKEMKIPELTEEEFKNTFSSGMREVTETVDAVTDIWPAVKLLNDRGIVEDHTYQNELVAHVYRNNISTFDHVLLPGVFKNRFVVIVVDIPEKVVKGYYDLNLNDLYGLGF